MFVKQETLADVLAEDVGEPDAEVAGAARIDAKAEGDDHIEVVSFDGAGDLALAFGLGLSDTAAGVGGV